MATQSGQLAAANAAASIVTDVATAGSVGINVLGTFVGTLVFEATTDGLNWFAVGAHPVSASGVLGGIALNTTTAGQFVVPVYGYTQVRARVSAYTSGTASVSLDVAASSPAGMQYVNSEASLPTYSAAVNAHAPAATPTDWFTIRGSATKTVRIKRITIFGRATAANQYRVSLKLYSVFATGGTPASVTAVPHDQSDPAATAAIQTWAGGLPTPGTAVGILQDDSIPQAAIGTPSGQGQIVYDFSTRNGKGIVLRGTAQYLALNSAAAALPAGSVFDVKVEFTEE